MKEFLELNPPEEFWHRLKVYLEKKEIKKEEVGLDKALNRILAEDIYSPVDLPPYSRSTVDGYAVKASDTAGASAAMPTYFDIIDEIEIGKNTDLNISTGEAAAIPTGGMIPQGADAVLMIENTEKIADNLIESFNSLAVGENVVKKGEDLKKDSLVFKKTKKITARDIGALAGLGITKLKVYLKAKVSVISTGDELISAEAESVFGQIRDINSYSLTASLNKIGAESKKIGIVEDKFEKLYQTLKQELDQDLVLISGGSSVGIKDMTVKLLNSFAEPGVILQGMAIKPGKPTILAVINETIVIGLPGHPSSCWMVNNIFVSEIVRVLNGEKKAADLGKSDKKIPIKAELTRNLVSDKGREEYIAVKLFQENEKLFAEPLIAKSALITNLVYGDALLKIPAAREGLDKGDIVEVNLIE